MYYAVLDTNVLVSAMLRIESVPGRITIEALLGDIIPLLHAEIIHEYREVLARPKFKFRQEKVDALIDGILSRGIFLEGTGADEPLPDPKDVIFYEITLDGRKTTDDAYLVTGNIRHFPVKPFVVTPREMLNIIEANKKA